jgi:photosystem II stability/assembly factor-like uncharacterized protein
MRRLFRLTLLGVILSVLAFMEAYAQPQVFVSGRIAQNDVRVFLKDSTYIIDRDYVIAGTLIIEPGTTVKFYPNGRIIDSTGGRIIADGLASASYSANPGGIDPIQPPGSPNNPNSYSGYADLDYFTYNGVVSASTSYDATIHSAKRELMFSVVLNKATRRIENLTEDQVGTTLVPGRAKVSFEAAMMFYAARLQTDPLNDVALNLYSWKRIGGSTVNVTNGKIFFKGNAVNNISQEWGHIIILPGARSAFFRNCQFENFKKDVAVDSRDLFNPAAGSDADYASLNNVFRSLTNGSGGAITTFSSRTWLLGVTFKNNFARVRGGALNILQTPDGFPTSDISGLGFYAVDKNPNLTERDGSISTVMQNHRIRMIDQIDEPGAAKDVLTSSQRRAYDDARLAIYLGRVRNLKFEGNKVQLAKVEQRQIGTPPVTVVMDVLDTPAPYPFQWGNHAYGGAVYISGKDGQPGEDSQIEIGFGVNNRINTSGAPLVFSDDTFEALGNIANNYQNNGSTFGARGGAIYVGKYTSLMVAGKYDANETYAKYLQDETAAGTNSGFYSRGGAIFLENTYGRLTVRGGPRREGISNQTTFTNNKSGAGGAIFQDGNPDPVTSPIVGGSDQTPLTRDYGYGIKFVGNQATSFGGAISTLRNLSVYGAGGVDASTSSLIGYGGNFPVLFENNTSGFSGGAVDIRIPNQNPLIPTHQRTVQFARVDFRTNTVGMGIAEGNKPNVRGGGAVYSLNGDINVVKGVTFLANKVLNGNGGAICMVNPMTTTERYYVNDIDRVTVDFTTGLVTDYKSEDSVFTYKKTDAYLPDARMLTRFLDNEVNTDSDLLGTYSGTGTTQIGWGTMGTGNMLHSITFLDANSGFAVGMYGTIIKFTNGGANWAYKNYPTPYRLKSVYFTNFNNGIIVGDRGLILKSSNNGNNWSVVKSAIESYSLNAVTFSGSLVGYAVGGNGMIFKTTDGGSTWFVPNSVQASTSNLNSVYFTGVNTGIIVGDRGTILVTTNGGTSWDVKNANTYSNLSSVYFVDGQVGFAVGSFGQMFKTTNGGNAWTTNYDDATKSFTQVFFTSQTTGYVVGDLGLALKTTNAGTSWTALATGTVYGLKSIFLPTGSDAYACGDYGQVIKSNDAGLTWSVVIPADLSNVDVKRHHPQVGLVENGIGLGGAMFILDSVTVDRSNRVDRIHFNRVRIQNNKAYTGAAIYSDNWNLQLRFNRSLISGNVAGSTIGIDQNVITGPVFRDNQGALTGNEASSDLASSILYGEIVGPYPDEAYTDEFASNAANSIYNNTARFLIRLPDAPNSKGVLAGRLSGFGGTDTLRTNYWGRTEANVNVVITNVFTGTATEETFFVENQFNPGNETYMKFMYPATTNPTEQGPFESMYKYSYTSVPFVNGANENTVGTNSIPSKVLMAGVIYDIHDKGTDIKTADYSARRMSPIEDFAIGIPPVIRTYNTLGLPSYGKYVKRWLRDPFVAEAKNTDGTLKYPWIADMQTEFRPDKDGNYYHPVGYPLFLETSVDYTGIAERSNHDVRLLNESVFFVINETTGDFIRTSMKQVDENAPYRELFRSRVDIIPDSTNRRPNTTMRRAEEGLYNLGTGSYLLEKLRWEPYKEDKSTLIGRRYSSSVTGFANMPNIFSNRPGMPASNNGNQTFYAGEKYQALPVNVNDIVRVVSRTMLWRQNVVPAYDGGISFKIVGSTEPPKFTGNVIHLQTDTLYKEVGSEYPWEAGQKKNIAITEFLNKIFVTEDREYPVDPGTYSSLPIDNGQGRDSILTITAMDTNRFYDPRSYHLGDIYPQFMYSWNTEWNSGLTQWLLADTISAGDTQHENPRDLAKGYVMFRGRPTNPYIVPGGETVYVSASNFPPTAKTVDYLKGLGLTQDQIDTYIDVFKSTLSQGKYDDAGARFLQQDTVDFGSNRLIDYTFKIFVVNQPPVFADWVETDADAETQKVTVERRLNMTGDLKEVWVVYTPSVYTCGMTPDDPLTSFNDRKMKANLTDKLRFQANFNTPDEQEDFWANQLGRSWDYRYGRTAYGFVSSHVRPGDEVIIDSTNYDSSNPPDGSNDQVLVRQNRPIWMANKYLTKYGTDNQLDAFGVDFQTNGQLNIRIDGAEAKALLTGSQGNGYLHVDTLFTVICNDGHGGMATLTMPVYVNVQPTILTTSLPSAKEDFDYNFNNGQNMVDSSKMIKIFDPNTDQEHRFELVYASDSRDNIAIDPCYSEAGVYDLTDKKTTPDWLKINTVSGLLYGVPGVKDAPRSEKVTVIVWDIIDGKQQLSAIKVLDLQVDSTNHKPHISAAPTVRCIDNGSSYSDTLIVSDYDLKRGRKAGDPTETLTLKVEDKNGNPLSGFTIEPSTITGIRDNDSVKVLIKTNNFNVTPDNDGKVTIVVTVTDESGMTDVLIYRLKYSDPTDFICHLLIENTWPANTPGDRKAAWQVLEFGTAPRDATTGDGLDNEKVGTLDYKFCEYDLPPIPPGDVFDARWAIPLTNGTHRNIFPKAKAGVEDTRIYKGRFQAGGEVGGTSIYYPVSLSWNKNEIPDKGTTPNVNSQWFIRDAGSNGNLFNYNMKTGIGNPGANASDYRIVTEGERYRVEIHNAAVDAFIILHDWASAVNETPEGFEAGIAGVTPNPASSTAVITIGTRENGNLRLDVVDALGNVVATIANADYSLGIYDISWNTAGYDGTPLVSGTYTLRLTVGSLTSTAKMIIVR